MCVWIALKEEEEEVVVEVVEVEYIDVMCETDEHTSRLQYKLSLRPYYRRDPLWSCAGANHKYLMVRWHY